MPWRIRQVIDKVEARAKEQGLPPELVVALWRQMIGWFIQYEEERLAQRTARLRTKDGRPLLSLVEKAESALAGALLLVAAAGEALRGLGS